MKASVGGAAVGGGTQDGGRDLRGQGWRDNELALLEIDSLFPNLAGDGAGCELGECRYLRCGIVVNLYMQNFDMSKDDDT
jgi:hypothetical protein